MTGLDVLDFEVDHDEISAGEVGRGHKRKEIGLMRFGIVMRIRQHEIKRGNLCL